MPMSWRGAVGEHRYPKAATLMLVGLGGVTVIAALIVLVVIR
ncbi:hypothetical protein V5N34_26815 [Streptomyces baarnensis]